MARPRAATYDQQRDAILAHAAARFADVGYAATTMQAVAEASGVRKATLYHYFADKQSLLEQIAAAHVARLEAVVRAVEAEAHAPRERLAALIQRFMRAYAGAQAEHRVLTEDVRFLPEAPREAVLEGQRRIVAAFARAVAALRPELAAAALDKPLALLLFGMMNWTFTWLQPGGALTHDAVGVLVERLFLGGLPAVPAGNDPPRR